MSCLVYVDERCTYETEIPGLGDGLMRCLYTSLVGRVRTQVAPSPSYRTQNLAMPDASMCIRVSSNACAPQVLGLNVLAPGSRRRTRIERQS